MKRKGDNMKRSEIIQKLAGLNELYEKARSFQTGNVGEWVGLGLLSEEEYAEYLSASAADSMIYRKQKDASDAITITDILDEEVPNEYRVIVERMAELRSLIDADKETRLTLRMLKESQANGLKFLSTQVEGLLKTAPDDYTKEYFGLETKRIPKERVGTIVHGLRLKLYRDYTSRQRQAKNDVLEHEIAWGAWSQGPYNHEPISTVLRRKKELERLVDYRSAAKRSAILADIKAILEETIRAGYEPLDMGDTKGVL